MNEKDKANKYDEIVSKTDNGHEVIDIEGQKWLRMHPDMEKWIDAHADMVEWMTEVMKFPPRSDCG